MFGHKVSIVALSALTAVSAVNFTIDPNSVDISTRATWCTAERNSCDQICSPATTNNCDPTLLTYACTCVDGTVPDLTQYMQTLPFFICETAFSQCNLANVGSQTGQANCTKTIQDNCGTKNASAAAVTTSTTAAPSGTASTAATSSSVSTTSSSHAGAMPTNLQHFGNGAAAVAVGVLAYML